MKKTLYFLLVLMTTLNSFAQTDTADNYVNKFATLPDFTIFLVPDSIVYSSALLAKNRPVVIMFFSPDCDHCQTETKELIAHQEALKNIPIIMVSSAPFQEIKDFYTSHNLSEMINIKVGQDIHFKLGGLFRLRTYPSIFVYDASRKLLKAFVGNIGVPTIIAAANNGD